MTDTEKARLDLGLRCCIQSAHTHICPGECPYTDEVINGVQYGCQGVLALEAQMRIAEMKHIFEVMRRPSPARLLTVDEAETYVGAAWLEVWYEVEEADPEYKEIMPVGVCMGNMADAAGDYTAAAYLTAKYNKPYGMRLWVNAQPSDEKKGATPWDS